MVCFLFTIVLASFSEYTSKRLAVEPSKIWKIAPHFEKYVFSDFCYLRLRLFHFFIFCWFSSTDCLPLGQNGPKKVQQIILSACFLTSIWTHQAKKTHTPTRTPTTQPHISKTLAWRSARKRLNPPPHSRMRSVLKLNATNLQAPKPQSEPHTLPGKPQNRDHTTFEPHISYF